ncbi:hypothetical protein N7540_012514 [Penicillium herquei]|nr:hypothetical protein N7540_012514 [Penicillium herquei]
MAIFAITTTGQFLYQVFRNKILGGKGLAIVQQTKLDGAIKLTFRPTRPWNVHAGQYIYLRIPAVSHFSFAETHPFNILWWEENAKDGKADKITILAQVKTGFTRRLYSCPQNSLRAIVDGPYGRPRDTDRYDSFVFISTGIGITAQLPYVKELINRGQRGYRVRRICLIWQAEQDAHDDWICEYANELIEMDTTEMVLRWALYINSPAPENGPGQVDDEKPIGDIGRRGLRYFGKPDLQSILSDEVGKCPTKLLLTVSGDTETREICRYIAIEHRKKIDFFETDFQPHEVSSGFWAPQVASEDVTAPRHMV